MDTNKGGSSVKLQLISAAFRDGAQIPPPYTCKGQNVSPPLNILNVPKEARSLALIMHDPDAIGSDFVHWVMWDISASTDTINANSVPVGAIQGPNSSGQNRYMGPCPPAGTGIHHYLFELYALDITLSLPKETNREQLRQAMKEHIVAQYTLTGLFSAD